jgi:hypothetical protein
MRRHRSAHLPDDFHDDFEEQLKIISQCPVCDAKFNARQSRILEDTGDSHLIYLNCKKCLNSVVAVIRFDARGINSIGMVTDLTYDDVRKFKDGYEVEADDVLGVHEALNQSSWQEQINQCL